MSRLAAYRRSAGTSTVLILTVLYFPLLYHTPSPLSRIFRVTN